MRQNFYLFIVEYKYNDIQKMINDAQKYAELDKQIKEKIEAINCFDNSFPSSNKDAFVSSWDFLVIFSKSLINFSCC